VRTYSPSQDGCNTIAGKRINVVTFDNVNAARLLDMHRTRLDRLSGNPRGVRSCTSSANSPGESQRQSSRNVVAFRAACSHRGAGARRTMAKAAADSALSVHPLAKQVPDKPR
jgi:hypothetical protein